MVAGNLYYQGITVKSISILLLMETKINNHTDNRLDYTNAQERINISYIQLQSVLRNAQHYLSSINPQHDESTKYIESFKSIIAKSIQDAEARINEVKERMVWDRLVVAFFGSTNAGKSTIIETLRIKYQKNKSGKDGDIVGDGSPDFTQTFDEYNIELNKTPITIIDMPGIEGNELNYIEKIRSALDKAHIIMYVYRDDTKPDTKTVEKIKSYLNDWVKVFSIFNVPGFSCSPGQPLHPQLDKAETLIKQGFADALGDTYSGNISVHAFAGLASVAEFDQSKKQFILRQKQLCERFANRKQLYSYSELPKLEHFLKERGKHYMNEIVEANKTRLFALEKQTSNAISLAIKTQENIMEQVPIELKKYRNDIDRYFNDCISEMRNSSHLVIKNNMSSFQKSCFSLIDNKTKKIKENLEQKQNYYMSKIDLEISEKIHDKISTLQNNIKRRSNKLKHTISEIEIPLPFNADNTRLSFEGVDSVINDILDIDKGLDILKNIAAGAALIAPLGAIGGPVGAAIGAAIGAILGVIKSVWDMIWGKKYRKQAKDIIREKITELKVCLIDNVDKALERPYSFLNNQKEDFDERIDKETKLIENVKQRMTSVCKEIRKYQNQIKQQEYGQI